MDYIVIGLLLVAIVLLVVVLLKKPNHHLQDQIREQEKELHTLSVKLMILSVP